MSRWLRLTPLLLVLALLWGGEVAAQRQWPNDVSGRPAPPCTIYDPSTNTTAFCSAANPLPINTGGSAGTGTTAGTSTTGFGKQWFPSSITGSAASAELMQVLFLDDLNVAVLRRSTGCGNCLQVAISPDGGVTAGAFVNTNAGLGNTLKVAFAAPTSPPTYLVSSIGGPLNIFRSTNLLGGWTAVTGLGFSVHTFASNATGSTILAQIDPGGGTQVCRSTNFGASFANCNSWGTASPGGMAGTGMTFAGGTTWLIQNNNGQILRSTDDGLTFSLITTIGAGRNILCLTPTYSTCIYVESTGQYFRSTDSGATWSGAVQTGAVVGGLCDYGVGNAAGQGVVATLSNSPPTGLAAVAQNAYTSLNAGVNWFNGRTNGSYWDGTGVPGILSMACRGGRGVASHSSNGSGINEFLLYNPLTQPGGVNQSSAGGYNVSALIQSGILLNAAPTTSAANTAATLTLTGTAGARICIREVAVVSSAAGTPTLVLQDATVTKVNYGTLATNAAPTRFAGSPLFCGETGNSVQVVVGAAGAGVTTTTSVVADRYPN